MIDINDKRTYVTQSERNEDELLEEIISGIGVSAALAFGVETTTTLSNNAMASEVVADEYDDEPDSSDPFDEALSRIDNYEESDYDMESPLRRHNRFYD